MNQRERLRALAGERRAQLLDIYRSQPAAVARLLRKRSKSKNLVSELTALLAALEK